MESCHRTVVSFLIVTCFFKSLSQSPALPHVGQGTAVAAGRISRRLIFLCPDSSLRDPTAVGQERELMERVRRLKIPTQNPHAFCRPEIPRQEAAFPLLLGSVAGNVSPPPCFRVGLRVGESPPRQSPFSVGRVCLGFGSRPHR